MRSAGVRGPSLLLGLVRGWDFGVRVGLHILTSGGFHITALANCRWGVACDAAGPENFAVFLTPPEAPLGAGCGGGDRLHNVSNIGDHRRRTGATPVHRCPLAKLFQ